MTMLDHPSHVATKTRPALLARAVQVIANFHRMLKNRREVHRMGEMSDTELADIGLARVDLAVALRSPFELDPTTHLGRLASERSAVRLIDDRD